MEKFDFSTLFWKKMVQVIKDFKACIEEGGDVVKFIEDNCERLSAVDYHRLFLLTKHTILRLDRYRSQEEDFAVANAIIGFICKEGVFTLSEPLNELISKREGRKIESYQEWDIIRLMFESQKSKDNAVRKELSGGDSIFTRELYGKTNVLKLEDNAVRKELTRGDSVFARELYGKLDVLKSENNSEMQSRLIKQYRGNPIEIRQ